MKKQDMLEAFKSLDKKLKTSVQLLIGGGAALVTAYQVPISTYDVDGTPIKSTLDLADLKVLIRKVGQELNIPQDWLNEHFSTFLFVLPTDYSSRLITVFNGTFLQVDSLGKEDLILMKCFAGRDKDIPHLKTLIKKGIQSSVVIKQMETLIEKKIPKAEKALELFGDVCDDLGVSL